MPHLLYEIQPGFICLGTDAITGIISSPKLFLLKQKVSFEFIG